MDTMLPVGAGQVICHRLRREGLSIECLLRGDGPTNNHVNHVNPV